MDGESRTTERQRQHAVSGIIVIQRSSSVSGDEPAPSRILIISVVRLPPRVRWS